MKRVLIFVLLIFSLNTFAQEIPDSLLHEGWNWTGVVGLNLSQTAFSNWSQGGSNSLAFSLFSNIGAVYYSFPWKVKNRMSIIYGRSKIEDQGYRTTDNEIYIESVTSRNIGWVVDPYFSASFRSSVSKGFDYAVVPEVQTVDFFDPGYLTQAVGFTYDHGKIFTSRLGIGFQETFANTFTAFTDDPETPEIETFKFDTGIESVTELKYEFLDNMTYYTFFRLFSRFNSLDVWDVRWENLISAKVNDYFSVNFTVTLLHEIAQTRRTQLRQSLQLGVSYSLF